MITIGIRSDTPGTGRSGRISGRMTPSLKEQLKWLRDAGFENVQCFWDGGRRALVGGFRR